MKSFSTLKEAIAFRIIESEKNYWIEDFWKEEKKIAIADIEKTLMFINECTDEEFFWFSEVFEEVAEATKSVEFVSALRIRLKKVTLKTYDQKSFKSEHMRKWVDYTEYIRSVSLDIDYAEGVLDYLLNEEDGE